MRISEKLVLFMVFVFAIQMFSMYVRSTFGTAICLLIIIITAIPTMHYHHRECHDLKMSGVICSRIMCYNEAMLLKKGKDINNKIRTLSRKYDVPYETIKGWIYKGFKPK